jgi:hypothetical protein
MVGRSARYRSKDAIVLYCDIDPHVRYGTDGVPGRANGLPACQASVFPVSGWSRLPNSGSER